MTSVPWFTTVCLLLAVTLSCFGRPQSLNVETQEESANPLSPQEIEQLWRENVLPNELNEDEETNLEAVEMTRRDATSSSSSTSLDALTSQLTEADITFDPATQAQMNRLKEQMKVLTQIPKARFEQLVSKLSPEQIQQIGENLLEMGQELRSEKMTNLGEELRQTTTQLSSSQIERLRKVEKHLYQDLNKAVNNLQADQSNPAEIMERAKSYLSTQLGTIIKLSQLIGKKLTSSSQIGESETATLTEKIQQIQSIGNDLQSRLAQPLEISQLSQIAEEFGQLQQLSSELQQTVSEQVAQQNVQEESSSSVSSTSSSNSGNFLSLQARDNADINVGQSQTGNVQTPREKPEYVKDLEYFFNRVKMYFNRLRKEAQENMNNSNYPYNLEKMPTFTNDNVEQMPTFIDNVQSTRPTLTESSSSTESIITIETSS